MASAPSKFKYHFSKLFLLVALPALLVVLVPVLVYVYADDTQPDHVSNLVNYHKKMIELGSVNSLIKLGEMYEKGEGVTKNIIKAEQYYKQAQKAGYLKANEALARIQPKLSPQSATTNSSRSNETNRTDNNEKSIGYFQINAENKKISNNKSSSEKDESEIEQKIKDTNNAIQRIKFQQEELLKSAKKKKSRPQSVPRTNNVKRTTTRTPVATKTPVTKRTPVTRRTPVTKRTSASKKTKPVRKVATIKPNKTTVLRPTSRTVTREKKTPKKQTTVTTSNKKQTETIVYKKIETPIVEENIAEPINKRSRTEVKKTEKVSDLQSKTRQPAAEAEPASEEDVDDSHKFTSNPCTTRSSRYIAKCRRSNKHAR